MLIGSGSAHFVEVVRQVRQRNVLVLNRLRRDVEARRRNDVAGKRRRRSADRRGLRDDSEKSPGPLERRRHHRGVAIVGLLLPQAGIAGEEEGLVLRDRAAERAAELIAIERVVGAGRPGGAQRGEFSFSLRKNSKAAP